MLPLLFSSLYPKTLSSQFSTQKKKKRLILSFHVSLCFSFYPEWNRDAAKGPPPRGGVDGSPNGVGGGGVVFAGDRLRDGDISDVVVLEVM